MFFSMYALFVLWSVICLSRVARGVDTLILPDRRSQGCLALRVPAPPPGPGGGAKNKGRPKKKPITEKLSKTGPPPPPEFNQA